VAFIPPARDGYNFLGWARAQGSTNVEYRTGDIFNVNNDTYGNLFAVYELDRPDLADDAASAVQAWEIPGSAYAGSYTMQSDLYSPYDEDWVRFVAPCTGEYRLSLQSDSADLLLTIYKTTAEGNPAGYTSSTFTAATAKYRGVRLDGGCVYYLKVSNGSGQNTVPGPYDLSVIIPEPS
jgi:hypothetical protein